MAAHISESELHARLIGANQHVLVGSLYRHYKGQTYVVTGLAITEATEEVVVLYQSQHGKQITFARPLAEWLEQVQSQGQTVPRFDGPLTTG